MILAIEGPKNVALNRSYVKIVLISYFLCWISMDTAKEVKFYTRMSAKR
jgi:hypothetical protein